MTDAGESDERPRALDPGYRTRWPVSRARRCPACSTASATSSHPPKRRCARSSTSTAGGPTARRGRSPPRGQGDRPAGVGAVALRAVQRRRRGRRGGPGARIRDHLGDARARRRREHRRMRSTPSSRRASTASSSSHPQQRAHEALQAGGHPGAVHQPAVARRAERPAVAFDQRGGRPARDPAPHRTRPHAHPACGRPAGLERGRGADARLPDGDVAITTSRPRRPCWATGRPTSDTSSGLKLLHHREFTAVFASNDQMALGIMHAAADLGLSVPGDLSVVGLRRHPRGQALRARR